MYTTEKAHLNFESHHKLVQISPKNIYLIYYYYEFKII